MVKLKELAPVVSFVSAFADNRDQTSPSAFLWFSEDGFVHGYSEAAGASWKAPAGAGVFSVRADGFASLLSSLASQYEDVEIERTAARLVVRAGAFRAQLPVWAGGAEAPLEWINRRPSGEGVEVDASFWTDVFRVKAAASSDEMKPGICGVYWSPDGVVAATDNFQAVMCTTRSRPPGSGVLIPSHALSLVGANPGFDRVSVDGESVWFHSSAGAGEVYGRLYDAEFPAKQFFEFMAAAAKDSATVVSAKGTTGALERLLFFARKSPYKVRAEVGASSVRFWTEEEDGDGRSAEEVIPAAVAGDPVAFVADGKAMREITKTCSSFSVNGTKPRLYFRSDDQRFEHVLSLLS